MLTKSVLFCAVLALTGPALAANLCEGKEEVVISFQVQNSDNKTASICQGAGSAYLVYRYGTRGNIELSFPAELNSTSWGEFEITRFTKFGGKNSSAVGRSSINFATEFIQYSIHEDWNSKENSSSVGVLIKSVKSSRDRPGVRSTQEGSIAKLNSGDTPFTRTAGE
jgi:hypothetical protein